MLKTPLEMPMPRALLTALPLLLGTMACSTSWDLDEEDDGEDPPYDGTDGSDGASDGADGASDGSDGATDGSDGASDGSDGGGDFLPVEGHWTIVDGGLIYDNCEAEGDDLPAGEDDGFTLTRNGTSGFTWVFDSTGDSATCTYTSGRSFSCDTMVGSEDIDGYNVTISSEVDISGGFSDEATNSSEWTVVVDCSGGDCWLAELASAVSFPCDFKVTVDAVAD